MMGHSHRIAGVVTWIAVAPTLNVHGWPVIAGAVFAGATANGRLSPDADRYPWLTKIIPGGHRGILHWWVLPAVAIWYVSHMTGPYQWQVAAVSVAWASHVVTDGVFGKIPLLPRLIRRGKSRWRYVGLSLKTGGRIEQWVAVPGFTVVGLWLIVAPLALRSGW